MKYTQHEANEQAALFQWAAWARGRWKELDLLYHIPNGGSRHPQEAANLKRQGVRAGVPDLFLPVPRAGFHGLYIEMKAGKNKPTALQSGWIDRLREQGYKAEVCYGWQAAARSTPLFHLHTGERNIFFTKPRKKLGLRGRKADVLFKK